MPAGAGAERVRQALRGLVEPPSRVEDPQTRRQLRVLLAILLVLTPLAYGVFLVPIGGDPVDPAGRETLLGLAAATGLLAAYVAGRPVATPSPQPRRWRSSSVRSGGSPSSIPSTPPGPSST